MKDSVDTRIVSTGCPAHNCGGRCLLRAHVRDGCIVRLDTDDRPEDPVAKPPAARLHAGTSLSAPPVPSGSPDDAAAPDRAPRRADRFVPVSWDEALDELAGQLLRVRDTHGHGALFVPYGTGGYTQLTGVADRAPPAELLRRASRPLQQL